jgi:hypothetical protein
MRSSYHSSNLPAKPHPDARCARNHDRATSRAYDSGVRSAVHHSNRQPRNGTWARPVAFTVVGASFWFATVAGARLRNIRHTP